MLATVLLPLSLSVLAGASAVRQASPPSSEPSVKVWLSPDDRLESGDKVKAYAQSREDGYLLVLQTDASGRVRVLFPMDPTNDQFVAAGKKIELKGRGGREAFVVDSGAGAVLAAYSDSRFDVEKFTQNGHWDFRALSASTEQDPEARMLDFVQQMQPSSHFSYDIDNYVASSGRYAGFRRPYVYPFYPYGYGYPYWGYDPFFGPRFGLGFGVVIGPRGHYYPGWRFRR